jgi:uncharacterized protein involved in exopolysaccharide biosynthesis
MNHNFDSRQAATADVALNPIDLIRSLRTHVRWWAIPAIACAVIAALYSLVAPRSWQATQALIVRPEAASVSEERLGKFADLSEMKTLQETILELARSQGVVQATLREVGPPHHCRRPAQWPTPLDVEAFRKAIDMRPPGGAEFGKTEVFYLSVRDKDRDRASALVAAACAQIEHRMQQLRDERAQGMIAELERTVSMANGDLAAEIGRLSSFEAKIGPDLVELRNLNADVGSQSGLSQELQSIEAERRANELAHRENIRLFKLLTAAHNDPEQLLATPSSLLRSQPAVSKLKDALVAAQLRTADLIGSRSDEHPFVIVARKSEESIRSQLHAEITAAIRSLEVDIELNADREQALAAKHYVARGRIARLAEARAEYANLVASVENHTRLVEAARKNLADARAHQAGALSASVISRIDGVEAGVRPVGPGRKAITAAGGLGGLLFGFGLVFLFGRPVTPAVVSAQRGSAEHVDDFHDGRPCSHNSNYKANGKSCAGHNGAKNLFQGMTLEEALRSINPPSST